MQQIWSKDKKEIIKELDSLISNKTKIVFVHQKTKQAKKILAKGVTDVKTGKLLILYYPDNFDNFDSTYICYYHQDGKPLRGFRCAPVKKADDYLGVMFPSEIFEIQRRAFPRVDAPDGSSATFSIKNKQRVMHGKIMDVSIAGARICGKFKTIIHKDDTVTPINLSLLQRYSKNEETSLIIPEATVVRSIGTDEMTNEVGLYFKLTADLKADLQEYIDIRSIEESN